MRIRHFVLVEPFRTVDVAIFSEEATAVEFYIRQQQAGKRAKIISQTGTVNDLKGALRQAREEMDDDHTGLPDRL